MEPKKSLGQHWLKDAAALAAICRAANLTRDDVVLEIGPGPGGLTRQLLKRAGRVIAVELDGQWADKLRHELAGPHLEVIQQDIRKFDLTSLPPGYKVVANIPYYLTSSLVRLLSETANPPHTAVLLVQKEVASRMAARPGQMGLLSVGTQFYFEVELGRLVPAGLFDPPPKVDSQLVVLKYRQEPLFGPIDTKLFFRIVKAGFAGRRKKLRGSLAAGLGLDKTQADGLLRAAGLSADWRAQNLSLEDWHKLYKASQSTIMKLL